MIKKLFLVLMLIQLFLLSSCTSGEPVDLETLEEILDNLVINTDSIMVNSIYTEDDINVDQIEMFDMTNRDEIMIHIISSSTNLSLNRDDMIMITSNWVYSTRYMTKTEHHINIYDDVALYAMIGTFTDLIDFNLITKEHISTLARSLDEPILTRISQKYTLRGRILTSERLDDDVVKMCEIIYEDYVLVGLNIQYEHTFRSTMQQSNYISGIHYYFGEEMIGEFPALNTFS